ncbi:cobaltochelatase subunit CobN [Methanothermobacter sp. K4]|uniref:cobaltochelatase subunit CobN n=1 Tax=Methanothermobacter sp. K4 TaxID=2913262 RepID=UPI002103CC51|nr:cobaltochelatase subunit CobN [Methanothermobacter sp. K4]
MINITVSSGSPLPNLIPHLMKASVTSFEVNRTYSLLLTLKNNGVLASGTFRVLLVDNGVPVSSVVVSSLGAGCVGDVVFNWTPVGVGIHRLQVVVDPDNSVEELNETDNTYEALFMVKKPGKILVLIVTDESQALIMNQAVHGNNILGYQPIAENVIIQIRSNSQITGMSENELLNLLSSCDIFIGGWLSDSVSSALQSIITAHPEVTVKAGGMFLILEPAVSSNPSNVNLMRYSNVLGTYILGTFPADTLMDYYMNTKRGTAYESVLNYTLHSGFPDDYNRAVLYKDILNRKAAENMILWALSRVGVPDTGFWKEPSWCASGEYEYGIYRDGWYGNLTQYMRDHWRADAAGCVGIIESTLYVGNQMLQPYYALIDAFEALNLNVIPVVAAGATPSQLDVMVKSFTDAPDTASFLASPGNYTVYVDAVVNLLAYGLGGEEFTNVTRFFEALNVPVFKAVHSDHLTLSDWELGTLGLGQITGDRWWHIAVPEAQGNMDPALVATKSEPVTDPITGLRYSLYQVINENIRDVTLTVRNWVMLGKLPDSEKRVALIYYNYPPGKNNVGSSYLDVPTSILNILRILKENGYSVENIPSSTAELLKLILERGINVASWAQGEVERLANTPDAVLYSVSEYMAWFSSLDNMTRVQVVEGPVGYIGELCRRAVNLGCHDMDSRIDSWYQSMMALLPDNQTLRAVSLLDNIVAILRNYVRTGNISYYNQFLSLKRQWFALNISGLCGWGDAPGNVMTVTRNGTEYFVIPGIWFGNIFICPEPQRGWEGDISKLYHSMAVAPPHQYLAVYRYIQENVNAMVHMGRHATYEWLPGKEVLLATYDFPEVVEGNIPQIYYYIVDGLAEGIQAKRRGSAVIIDHLTPPMVFTALYGGYGALATLIQQYDGATEDQRSVIINRIHDIIRENKLQNIIETYLGTSIANLRDEELVSRLEAYLEGLQSTLYPHGLHAIGENWTSEEVAMLVTSILSVPFSVSPTIETSLHDEMALLLYGKPYSNLTASQRSSVQDKCVSIIQSIISSGLNATIKSITATPSDRLVAVLQRAVHYIDAIHESTENEVKALLEALDARFIDPGPGADPVSNPDVLPTGRNFFQDQAAEIPTVAAWEYGKTLALLLLQSINDTTEKVAVGIWCVETARDDGALISMVLYLLGMEPRWSDSPSAGVGGQKLKEMPAYVELKDLVRPSGWTKRRIDAVIVTSGLFRDLYSRQAGLLDKAFRTALARSYYTVLSNPLLRRKYGSSLQDALDAVLQPIGFYGLGSEPLDENYVAKHWVEDFEYYISLNFTPREAGEWAISRIFAPPENDYGVGISKSAELSWTWENRTELADFYLNRMGNIYSSTRWGTSNPAVFRRTLQGISQVFTSRNTNLYGVLDNDDFFDYWGGLSMALERVNGYAPSMYVLNYATRSNPGVLSLESYMAREMASRYYNPEWIRGMMNEGYSGARYMSRKFISNLWGWQVTRPGSVSEWMWETAYDVYIRDKYGVGVSKWLSTGDRAYAMISITGTMLTAIHSGYWHADEKTVRDIASRWASSIAEYGVACCDCSCGNIAMMEWAMQYLNPDLLARVKSRLYAATMNAAFAPAENPSGGGEHGSTPGSNPQTDNSGSSVSENSVTQPEGPGAHGESQDAGSGSDESSPGSEGSGKSYEIHERGTRSYQATGLPLYAILGVLVLVALVGAGYFMGLRRKPY